MLRKGTHFQEVNVPIDLTIYDFADNKSARGRIRKSKRSNYEESVLDDDFVMSRTVDTTESKQAASNIQNPICNEYSIDIWFLISEYIRPEDVGRFSLICKATLSVVSTAKFWFHIYRKFYSNEVKLPLRLQPACMQRFSGLRSSVIKALFHMYPPFVRRSKFTTNLDTIINLQLVTAWQTKAKNLWVTCLKLRRKMCSRKSDLKLIEADSWDEIELDLMHSFDDIYYNPDEGCKILSIFSTRFIPLPILDSQKVFISDAVQPLSQDLCNRKIKLTFGDYCAKVFVTASFDPVVSCKIHDWYSPEYMLSV